MSSPISPRVRTLLYFLMMVLAIVAAFVFGYWEVQPRAGDQFTRLTNVGKNYYEQGNGARAVEIFSKAAELRPGNPDVLLNLANACLLNGQSQAALKYAQQAASLDPNDPAAHYVMGCAYLRLSKFEDAVKELQTSKNIDQKINPVSFQLGRAYAGWGKFDQAVEQFREVIQFEDHGAQDYISAHYNLGQALVRLGQTDEANQVLGEYQKLIADHPIRAGDVTALERCVYTQIRAPFELEQPDRTGIKVQFVDATSAFFPNSATNYHGPIGVLDVNHRGTNDIFLSEGQAGFRLLFNSNGTFQALGDLHPATAGAHYSRCLVGDLNNDRMEDVVMVGDKGVQAFRFATNGAAIDATAAANLKNAPGIDGALVDLDFTGKLDLLLVPPGSNTVRVMRNLGNMYFKDGSATSGVPSSVTTPRRLAVDDWNNDDVTDLFIVRAGHSPLVLLKERGGSLTESNAPANWPEASAIALGDLNNDLRTDAVLATPGQLVCILGGLTNRVALPTGDFTVSGMALVDYDNDGWLDICAWGNGLRVWRNLGTAGFREVTTELGLNSLVTGQIDDAVFADFDNDGDTDFLVSVQNHGVQLLRNEGGNANQQLKIRLSGNRSNASALGVRVELAAGHWRTIRTVSSLPTEVGVGQHKQIDSLNIHWMDAAQSVAEVPVDPHTTMALFEIVVPTGSCPYLYAWDGSRFRFVTDILGASPAGLPVSESRLVEANPDEYVWIGSEQQFPPREGKLVLQITEELREVLYLDQARLAVVDHPAGTEVHPTDKMVPGRPFPPSDLWTLGQEHPLRRATTLTGQDVTDLVRATDGKWLSPAKLRTPQLRGLAEPHGVILDFGPLPIERPLVLALTGWLRFGGGMANVAGSQDSDLPFPFPSLEVETQDGLWQRVNVEVGVPAGKTKTILVDLTGKLPTGSRRLRLSSAFELHWDRIALLERLHVPGTEITSVLSTHTDLHWRGYSDFQDLPWTFPLTPDYNKVRSRPNWLITPSGWCTRYGAVDELVAQEDDALVLLNGGDELTLEFSAAELPHKPHGYVRDFFLYTAGWDKDADFHVVAGTTVEPLPFHGMDDQLYGKRPPSKHSRAAWVERFNTRWVTARAQLPRSGRNGGTGD